jgi:hypothetical protein
MEKTIIIFRFHQYPDICFNRLELLKYYNPHIPIYGIYGGNMDELLKHGDILGEYLCNIYTIRDRSDDHRWRQFDFTLLDWYREFGKNIDFDMAYVSEWDLLMFGSIEDLFSHINNGDVGLTALIPLSQIENRWYWTTTEPYKSEWERLLDFAVNAYQFTSTPYASLGPGLCFPKSFLGEYDELYMPYLCHDEMRTPLAAQILGYPIKDTGFFRNWFDPQEWKYFNCDNQPINMQTIRNELVSNGRKAFHPFREIFDLSDLSCVGQKNS